VITAFFCHLRVCECNYVYVGVRGCVCVWGARFYVCVVNMGAVPSFEVKVVICTKVIIMSLQCQKKPNQGNIENGKELLLRASYCAHFHYVPDTRTW